MPTLNPEQEAFLKEHLIEETPETMQARRDAVNKQIWQHLNLAGYSRQRKSNMKMDHVIRMLEDVALEMYIAEGAKGDLEAQDLAMLRDVMRVIDWLRLNPND